MHEVGYLNMKGNQWDNELQENNNYSSPPCFQQERGHGPFSLKTGNDSFRCWVHILDPQQDQHNKDHPHDQTLLK